MQIQRIVIVYAQHLKFFFQSVSATFVYHIKDLLPATDALPGLGPEENQSNGCSHKLQSK